MPNFIEMDHTIRTAFANPEFQARLADYPQSATVSPHLFRPLAVPGICIADPAKAVR